MAKRKSTPPPPPLFTDPSEFNNNEDFKKALKEYADKRTIWRYNLLLSENKIADNTCKSCFYRLKCRFASLEPVPENEYTVCPKILERSENKFQHVQENQLSFLSTIYLN